MLARRWQSYYCKPGLWTPSPVLIRFHPPASLPFLPPLPPWPLSITTSTLSVSPLLFVSPS